MTNLIAKKTLVSQKLTLFIIAIFLLFELYYRALGINIPTTTGYICLVALLLKNLFNSKFALNYIWKIQASSIYFMPFFSFFIFTTFTGYYPLQGIKSLLAVAVLYFVIINYESTQFNLNGIVLFSGTLAATSVCFIISNTIPFFTLSRFRNHLGGFNGLIGSSTIMGQYTALSLLSLLSFYILISSKSFPLKLLIRIGIVIVIFIASLMAVATLSRSAYLVISLYLVFMLTCFAINLIKPINFLWLMVLLLFISEIQSLVVNLAAVVSSIPIAKKILNPERLGWVFNKIQGFLKSDSSSDNSRVRLFETAINLLTQDNMNLIFGYGPGFIDSVTTNENIYRDSGYLGMMLDIGILGLALLFLFVLRYLYSLIKLFWLKEKYLDKGIVMVLTIPICFLFDIGNPVLYSFGSVLSIIIYLLMGITISIEAKITLMQKSIRKHRSLDHLKLGSN